MGRWKTKEGQVLLSLGVFVSSGLFIQVRVWLRLVVLIASLQTVK
jgi:hypothetical protein